MEPGIIGQQAPELRVATWLDADGAPRPPLTLHDLGDGIKIIYCFQHWCPGCHSHGFPTLKRLVDALTDRNVGFAVIQTVFEGEQENTVDKLHETQERYGLRLPFGHDTAIGSARLPTIMTDYRTGGTPWFIVIGPSGEVAFNGFSLDADRFLEQIANVG